MKRTKVIIALCLAVVLFVTQFFALNAFVVSNIFKKEPIKKAVSSDEIINSLVSEITGGVVSGYDNDIVTISNNTNIGEFLKREEYRKKMGIVTDDVIIRGLRTEVIADKFAETALSYAQAVILGKEAKPLTEADITAMRESLDKELEKIDPKVMSKDVANNISLDFKYNPKKLATETNGYLQQALASGRKISGVIAFGYKVPLLWAIISIVLMAAIIVLLYKNKVGFALSGSTLLLASIIVNSLNNSYASLFGNNVFVGKAVSQILDSVIPKITLVPIITSIVLILVTAYFFIRKNMMKKSK